MTSPAFSQQQIQALSDLYYGTNGIHWQYGVCSEEFYWNFTQANPNPCTETWCGVVCGCSNQSNPCSESNTVVGLYLNNFALIGSIPSSISMLVDLQVLDLSMNFVSGTIPLSVGNLTRLQELSLGYNSLILKIPPIFTRLQNLTTIDLIHNSLTGTVPVNILEAKNLRSINLAYNKLTGNISTWLSTEQWSSLVSLDIRNNQFSGRIPYDVKPVALQGLYLKQNQFTGPIPDIFSQSTNLQFIFLSYNAFTGAFPVSLNSLANLKTLIVDNNFLSGSLDANGVIDWRNLPALSTLSLTGNHFTGEFVPAWCALQMDILNIGYNSLHGPLPPPSAASPTNPEINECQSTLFPAVSIFTLQGNYFSGPLHEIFNTSLFHYVGSLALSNNRFTGTLPGEFFLNAPDLQVYGAGGNCLSGTLPPEFCTLIAAEAFSIDGASTASNCQIPIVDLPLLGLNAFLSKTQMTGTIPSCYFDFVFMKQLHLSGNGFTGSISSQQPLSTSFQDLSLSHNRLTGTIPHPLLQHSDYESFDLSYNKLSGSLENVSDTAFDPDYTQIALNDNRLSGRIPALFRDFQSISLLQGNLFTCNNVIGGGGRDGNLPPADPNYAEYSCGSNVINTSIYLWLGLVTAASLITLWCSLSRRKGKKSSLARSGFWKAIHSQAITPLFLCNTTTIEKDLSVDSQLSRYFSYSLDMRRYAVSLMVFILIVLLPVYSGVSEYYRTYVDSYAWFISAAYLSGTTATIVLLVFFVVFLLFAKVILSQFLVRRGTTMKPSNERKWQLNQWGLWLIAWAVNVTIMITADSLYVYLFINHSTQYDYLLQMVLALFKLGWNDFGLFRMVFWLKQYFQIDYRGEYRSVPFSLLESGREERVSSGEVSLPLSLSFEGQPQKTVPLLNRVSDPLENHEEEDDDENHYRSRRDSHSTTDTRYLWFSRDRLLSTMDFRYLTYMSIINKVAIPCLAIFFISSSCFYNALVSTDPESANFKVCYAVAQIGDDQCVNILGGDEGTTYTPAFSYSYQCSSAFLTDYLPVFVFMFIWSSVVLPGLLLGLMTVAEMLKQRIRAKQRKQRQQTTEQSWLSSFPEEIVSDDGKSEASELDHNDLLDSPSRSPGYRTDHYLVTWEVKWLSRITAFLPIGWKDWSELVLQQHCRQLILHRKQLLTLRISYTLAVMIVFGSLFPPLAVIAGFAICSLTLFEDYVTKHQLLSGSSPSSRSYFEEECREIDRNVQSEMRVIFFLAAALQGFLLFDTCGDRNGWVKGLIPMIIMMFVPFLVDLLEWIGSSSVWIKIVKGIHSYL